jgi:HSP20 family molecular chaperone IbpA
MVELSLKTEMSRPTWSFAEENPYHTPESVHWRFAMRAHIWRPPTDMYETEETIVIRVEIAGMREQDFTVALEERTLSIRGVRSDPSERRAFHQMEIPFGEFSTEVELPSPIVPEGVEAIYREGFLQITLPKVRPQHIQVGN